MHLRLFGRLGGLLGRLGAAGSLLGHLLGQKNRMDVGQDAAVRDGDAGQQPPELLVVADGQEHVARDDARLLVVPGRVPSQLQHLGGEVLEDGGEVDGGAAADALRVAALLEVAPDTADGELEPGLHGPRHRLLPGAARLAPGRSLLHLPDRSGTGHVHCCCFDLLCAGA
jgi:hypothetical protein